MSVGSELGAALVLSAGFASAILAAELWRLWGGAKPESTRKLVHVASGVGCAVMPFVLDSFWTVLAMSVVFTAFFAITRRLGWLPSLHRVDRATRGSEYYPIAVALLFLISGGEPGIYLSAMLVLALADAAAALVGKRFGRHTYEVEGQHKTLEGSLAFFVVAVAVIGASVAVLCDVTLVHALLAAVLVAAIVTVLEAISLSGADNLFIPLCTAVALQKTLSKPPEEAIFQLASFSVIGLGIFAFARVTNRFNVGGTLYLGLFVFSVAALSSWLAAGAVLALLVVVWLFWASAPLQTAKLKVRYLMGLSLPPFFFVVLGSTSGRADFYFGAFLAAMAVVAGAWVLELLDWMGKATSKRHLVLATMGVLAAVMGVPLLFQPSISTGSIAALAFVVGVAAVFDHVLVRRFGPRKLDHRWSARRFALASVAGGVMIVLQSAGWISEWAPSAADSVPREFMAAAYIEQFE